MRITKKTDPLFKPLKKLKTALEVLITIILQSIGYHKVSLVPTSVVVLFHFGLGNELDLEFIRGTGVREEIVKNNPILPGKSYCFL
jgi:hypothetical protein